MIRVAIIDSVTGQILDRQMGFSGKPTLITENLRGLNALWQTGISTGAVTNALITPLPNTSILLTDIIITSTKKVALSTIIVQFNDGSNTKLLMEIEAATAPVQFSHAFVGGVTGWKDAALQIVTNQAAMNVTVMIGYVKISKILTKTYDEWLIEG
jgi:hypothetical protein